MRGPAGRHLAGVGTTLAGMLLIAGTYGMARFGVGLFAPSLAADRPGLIGVLGFAAAAQFISYCLAAAVAARLVDRHPRMGLILAGATATAGCLGVAVAQHPAVFVVALIVGGMGGGFASPALVPVLDAVIAPRDSATAQSVVNAGTAVGVVGAGFVAFTLPAIGPAWLLMALACAAAAVGTWYPVRGRALNVGSGRAGSRLTGSDSAGSAPGGTWRALLLPAAAATVAGAGSSLIWTFGPLLMTGSGAVAEEHAGWLWIALGAGGLSGAATGALVERIGRRGAWSAGAGALALAAAGVALSVASGIGWVAYVAMALFGAGYMGLSAVLILWARQVMPGGAGAGTSVLFIALASGQALGSVAFGAVHGLLSPALAAALAAGLCAAGGVAGLLRTAGAPPTTAPVQREAV